MNKKKRGFTIVELLAVLIILAVVALIGSAVVKKTIEKSRVEAVERGAELYIKTVETTVGAARLKGNVIEGDFAINKNGDLCPKDDGVNCPEDQQILIEMIGNKPSQGTLSIYDGQVKPYFLIAIKESKNLYSVKRDGDDSEYTATKGYDSSQSPVFIASPKSFAKDSWNTIGAAVKSGNLSKYNVGDTKKVTLSGKISGTYTVRIANTSTPEECNTSGFSQTACGFVVEFADIITQHVMNSESTSLGGWEESEMRYYVYDTILPSLPEELRKVIITTYAVSGHARKEYSNYVTTDSLYLLSGKEVWGCNCDDTAAEQTRQLDYYKNKGVTTSNYSEAIKKFKGSQVDWWLRSAETGYLDYPYHFQYVTSSGYVYGGYSGAANRHGVSPAFRIG